MKTAAARLFMLVACAHWLGFYDASAGEPKWEPYESKHFKLDGFRGEQIKITVPVDHYKSNVDHETTQISLRRFFPDKLGRVAARIWLVGGGPPGVKAATAWEKGVLSAVAQSFQPQAGIMFYLVEQRGVGKSQKMAKSNDTEFMSDLEGFLNRQVDPAKKAVPLNTLTSANAAWDLISVTKYICNMENDSLCSNNYIMASGHGAVIAQKAINNSEAYAAVALDSPDPQNLYKLNTVTGIELVENCLQNEYCRWIFNEQQLDVERFFNLIATIGSKPELNACTKIFHESIASALSLRTNIDLGLTPCAKMHVFFSAVLRKNKELGMKLIGVLVGMAKCAHPDRTAMGLQKIIQEVGNNIDPLYLTSGSNLFVHAYLSTFEDWGLPSVPPQCATDVCPKGLLDSCPFIKAYEIFRNLFIAHQPTTYTESNESTSAKTKIYVLTGKLDYTFPNLLVFEWIKQKFTTQKVTVLEFKNEGHGLLKNGPCMSEFAETFLGKPSELKLTECMQRANAGTLNWQSIDELFFPPKPSTNSAKSADIGVNVINTAQPTAPSVIGSSPGDKVKVEKTTSTSSNMPSPENDFKSYWQAENIKASTLDRKGTERISPQTGSRDPKKNASVEPDMALRIILIMIGVIASILLIIVMGYLIRKFVLNKASEYSPTSPSTRQHALQSDDQNPTMQRSRLKSLDNSRLKSQDKQNELGDKKPSGLFQRFKKETTEDEPSASPAAEVVASRPRGSSGFLQRSSPMPVHAATPPHILTQSSIAATKYAANPPHTVTPPYGPNPSTMPMAPMTLTQRTAAASEQPKAGKLSLASSPRNIAGRGQPSLLSGGALYSNVPTRGTSSSLAGFNMPSMRGSSLSQRSSNGTTQRNSMTRV